MSSLPPAAPGHKPAVPDPGAPPLAFPAVLTDEAFDAWLDAYGSHDGYPSRRESHERLDAAGRARERARIARMYALRGCDAAVAFASVLSMADKLHEALGVILRRYPAGEAGRVLASAGLPIPGQYDVCWGWGADTFDECLDFCRVLRRRLRAFATTIDDKIRYVMPTATEGGAA